MKTFFIRLLFVVATLASPMVITARAAEDLAAVKSRMDGRLAKIVDAKAKGSVGENNKGFLEVRGDGAGVGSLVDEENKDRRAVYAALAQQNKTSVDDVGKLRASQIARNAKPGEWVQKDDGTWAKK